MCVLQSTHGLGVRPARYSEVKRSITAPPNSSRMSTTKWGKPRSTATRRASFIDSTVQQPICLPVDAACAARCRASALPPVVAWSHVFIVMPTTS